MLKHSYLLTPPAREAECQIRGPHYFIVLEKIRGRNWFPTATLLFVHLSPAGAGGDVSPGEAGEEVRQRRGEPFGGLHQVLGLLQKTTSEPCCGQGVPAACLAHQGATGHVSLPGLSPASGERMVTVPLWVCCAFAPSRSLICSPGLFTLEHVMDKQLLLVLSIGLLVQDWWRCRIQPKQSLCQGRRLSPCPIGPSDPSQGLDLRARSSAPPLLWLRVDSAAGCAPEVCCSLGIVLCGSLICTWGSSIWLVSYFCLICNGAFGTKSVNAQMNISDSHFCLRDRSSV